MNEAGKERGRMTLAHSHVHMHFAHVTDGRESAMTDLILRREGGPDSDSERVISDECAARTNCWKEGRAPR